MSKTQRIFADRVVAGIAIDGTSGRPWYCLTREGILGPYKDERQAATALREFIEHCIETGATGGRDSFHTQPHWIPRPSCLAR